MQPMGIKSCSTCLWFFSLGIRFPYYGAYGFGPFAPRMTRKQELELLKTEADALRQQLKQLENRIGQLSMEKE